ATLMVALAIPVSIISAFVLMDIFDRTLNVISLAGLAFAVGMVLDAAIVVLENISRLKEHGETNTNAAIKGATQVWGALFASTVTTVAIFMPIVFMQDESGQLFADLALTIAVSIIFSLITAVTVLPTVARRWFGERVIVDPHTKWWDGFTHFVMTITSTGTKRAVWIVSLMSLSVLLMWTFLPKTDYLPPGNRNLVFAFIFPPPGVNVDTMENEMGKVIAEKLQPYVDKKASPTIKNYFFVTFPRGAFMGMRADDPTETEKLLPLMNRLINGFPDTFGFAMRASMFGRMGGANSIDLDIRGQDLEALIGAAQLGFGEVSKALPGSRIRPLPGLDLGDPELKVIPLERNIAEAGWDRDTVASITRALGSGLYLGDYFDGDRRMDVILRSQEWSTPEDLASIPLATPNSGVVSLGDLVQVTRTAGPEQIRRSDRRRTVTLQITPPKGMSMEEAIQTLREKVEPKILDSLPEGSDVLYAGTAEKLDSALSSMTGSFVLAIVILFLLMAAMFRSFKDSALVLFTIPLATVGGVLGLAIFGLTMDLLTMIGFIILLGLVVNNAILLVHQTRTAEREGLSREKAVQQAVRLRLRPILMSTLTSIFGMIPLVVITLKNSFPGVENSFLFQALPDFIRISAGAELYSGLAIVIVGGMMVSTLFTLILLPSLLRIGEHRHPGTQNLPQV
ncbi:MAG: efflux RND transporter permease subunit, partial [Gammaproteobacteria bacterium]|nr:efflux RND transporter permease subunit [Gammaproteobacteria bacterium]